jgi:hypothetical protein
MTVVVDSSGVPVLGVPVSLINLDTSLVAVRSSRYVVARTGTPGGQARVIAQIRSDADTLFVSVIVPTQPAIGLSTGTVTFNATAFGGNPAAQTVNVSNAGTGDADRPWRRHDLRPRRHRLAWGKSQYDHRAGDRDAGRDDGRARGGEPTRRRCR